MRFVFSKLFYLLVAGGFILLSLSWGRPWLRWVALAYDVVLITLAIIDARRSKLPQGVNITREFGGRFAVGAKTEVRINVQNAQAHAISLVIKDEYPARMKLSDLSRWNLVWVETRIGEPVNVKVYPNMRRAREAELKALGARSLVASHRKTSWRGEGREFESLRDYVRGDELRHISWTATARRGKLTTRQYQIERDQTILIAIDGGRLMTARIEQETKLDSAVHAALALMSAAARAGDNAGLLVFGRKIKSYLPPGRGRDHMDAALEALYAVEPDMIEPSYSHALEFIAAHSKRRSLVVLLTDLVDEEGSKELLASLRLLRPRHLPLVVTIADRDLKAVVSNVPENARDLFTQSVAEEIMYLREAALRRVESQGGLALDVTAAALAPSLLEKYLQVKERGLL
jgi:uncharacterized protein (DUF58 family)